MEAGNAAQKVRWIKLRKTIAIVVAATMILGITAYAATVILNGRSSHSYNIPSYYSVPDAQTLQSDIGFAPKIVTGFSNGYRYKSGHIVNSEDYAEDGSVFERYKGLSCVYTNGTDNVHFYADMAAAGIQLQPPETADVYKGCDLLYYSYTNKLVPPNYEMTPRDKEDEQSGRLVFSWGSSEVKLSEVQSLAWEYNGINYVLNVSDSPVSKEELLQMAREIIDL